GWVRRRGYSISRLSLGLTFLLGASCSFMAFAVESLSDPWLRDPFYHEQRWYTLGGQAIERPVPNSEPQRFVSMLSGAFIEEFVKMLAAFAVVSRQCSFRRPVYGVICGTMAAVGFSAGEDACWLMQGRSGLLVGKSIGHVLVSCFWGAALG